MRTSLLNTFFSFVLILGNFPAMAFKGSEQEAPRMERPPMNPPAFQNTESKDGGTLFRGVEMIPSCEENKITLFDNGVEISFYAKHEVCMNLISDVGWGACGILVGDAFVKLTGNVLLSRYEILEVSHSGCPPVAPRRGKAY